MAKPGDVIDVPALGVRVEFRATGASTGGAYTEVDVVGNARGFITRLARACRRDRAPHGDRGRDAGEAARQAARARRRRRDHDPARHAALPAARERGQRPDPHPPDAERAQRRVLRAPRASSTTTGFGFPKPRSAARFVRELGASGHAARPSLKIQQRLAALLDDRYEFVDEWDVHAPPEDVFDTLADGTTYPQWWKPVYIGVTHDGEFTHQHFKGRLPYHLHTRTKTTRSERPHTLQGETVRRPARHRPLDAHADRDRPHPRALRLARARRPPAAEGPDAVRATRAALEPPLGDRPRDRGARALRRERMRSSRSELEGDTGDEGARAGEGPGQDARLRARPEARVLRARGRRAPGPRPGAGVQDARRRRRRRAHRRHRPRREPARPEGAGGGGQGASGPRWPTSSRPSATTGYVAGRHQPAGAAQAAPHGDRRPAHSSTPRSTSAAAGAGSKSSSRRPTFSGSLARSPQRSPADPYGVVVDSVNVSVLLYVARAQRVAGTDRWVNSIATASLDTGPVPRLHRGRQTEPPTFSGCGSENAPLTRWPVGRVRHAQRRVTRASRSRSPSSTPCSLVHARRERPERRRRAHHQRQRGRHRAADVAVGRARRPRSDPRPCSPSSGRGRCTSACS